MNNSIREQIVQNIQSAIRNVKKKDDYQFDIDHGQVKRNFNTLINDMNIFPCVYLFEGSEEEIGRQSSGSTQLVQYSFDVSAVICITEGDELSRYINNLEADVRKAVMVDSGRNDLAHYTESIGSEPFALEGTEIGGRTVFFKIVYEVNEANPYSQS